MPEDIREEDGTADQGDEIPESMVQETPETVIPSKAKIADQLIDALRLQAKSRTETASLLAAYDAAE